jgi:hypothetical protein
MRNLWVARLYFHYPIASERQHKNIGGDGMSDLAHYQGNFINFADKEFNFHTQNQRRFGDGITGIDVCVSCHVGVFPSPNGETLVELDTETPEDFLVTQEGTTVVITQKPQSPNINVTGRVTTISGISGGVKIINGEIYINGVKQDLKQPQNQAPPSKVRMYVPANVELDAELKVDSVFASKVIFGKATVVVHGEATIGLAARSLEVKISGEGKNYAVVKGGSLDIDVSGEGKVRVKGEFSDADVSVSGMGGVFTEGTCHGNYRASVSGTGSISHSGSVAGRVKESVSGMGSINIG